MSFVEELKQCLAKGAAERVVALANSTPNVTVEQVVSAILGLEAIKKSTDIPKVDQTKIPVAKNRKINTDTINDNEVNDKVKTKKMPVKKAAAATAKSKKVETNESDSESEEKPVPAPKTTKKPAPAVVKAKAAAKKKVQPDPESDSDEVPAKPAAKKKTVQPESDSDEVPAKPAAKKKTVQPESDSDEVPTKPAAKKKVQPEPDESDSDEVPTKPAAKKKVQPEPDESDSDEVKVVSKASAKPVTKPAAAKAKATTKPKAKIEEEDEKSVGTKKLDVDTDNGTPADPEEFVAEGEDPVFEAFGKVSGLLRDINYGYIMRGKEGNQILIGKYDPKKGGAKLEEITEEELTKYCDRYGEVPYEYDKDLVIDDERTAHDATTTKAPKSASEVPEL